MTMITKNETKKCMQPPHLSKKSELPSSSYISPYYAELFVSIYYLFTATCEKAKT